MAAIEIENMAGEMLECLDVDIEHFRENLARLNEMRGLVIKRDDAALQALLDDIHLESESYKENESRRQMIRKKIADSLECGIEKITLSLLETTLSEPKRRQVCEKRTQLKSLVNDFKKEYSSTIVLVSECARFNKMMIKSIFNHGKTNPMYYGANGAVREQKDNRKSWLVNCDL
jgi:hypothetical protein